ncbi:MAG: IPTL-CTERM sorting domain-containing protein [Nitrospirae bacterium]|nr:IPTL-CTERM sorting domain-containing protein [Nitrospirota bacterium]
MGRKLLFSVLAGLILILICVYVQPVSAELLGCDNTSGNLFSIDEATGASTLIGTMPQTMTECVYDNLNLELYAQGSDGSFTLYRIDPATGASLGSVSTGAALNGMEFVNGTLYATAITCSLCNSDLVTVNPSTGVLTTIGATGFGPVSGLAYDNITGIMYGVTGGGGPANLLTINLSNGAGSIVGATGLDRIGSIRFGNNGVLYGGLTSNASTFPNYLITINKSTGAATPVGNTGFSITGLALIALTVPTMNEWGMIIFVALAGLGSIYYIRKHRRV